MKKSRGGRAFTYRYKGGSHPGRIYIKRPCPECGKEVGSNVMAHHRKTHAKEPTTP